MSGPRCVRSSATGRTPARALGAPERSRPNIFSMTDYRNFLKMPDGEAVAITLRSQIGECSPTTTT
jgi:hypothetical protein